MIDGRKSNYSIEYICEQLDRGNSLQFIARDAGIQLESLLRRLDRAEKSGLLPDRYVNVIKNFAGANK